MSQTGQTNPALPNHVPTYDLSEVSIRTPELRDVPSENRLVLVVCYVLHSRKKRPASRVHPQRRSVPAVLQTAIDEIARPLVEVVVVAEVVWA